MKRLNSWRRWHAARMTISAVALLALLLLRPTAGATAPADRVARGLDVLLHAPESTSSGSLLPLTALALGFPSLATTVALDGAEVEATWDPDTLDLQRSGATLPASVATTTDARGRATLSLRVPDGDPRKLGVLVAVRHGGKERVQRLEVQRVRKDDVDLLLGDASVVPGGVATAWAIVRDLSTGAPRPGVRVEIRLLDGAAERHRAEATTDVGGTAAFRVPIPRSREPSPSWDLVAQVASADPQHAAKATVKLATREETPGQPRLRAIFDQPTVTPGAKAAWRVRLRDATDEPVSRTEVRVWSGPRSAKVPTEEKEWLATSKALLTSLDGEVRGEVTTPSVVPPGGLSWKLVARASIAGTPMSHEAALSIGRARASVRIVPEGENVVPGVEQRVFVELLGEDETPLVGTFRLRGDGLDASVKLDAQGQAEATWKAPAGVGGFRGVGPCAGNVAAALQIEAVDEAATRSLAGARLTGWDDLPICVAVDKEAELLVRIEPPIARPGERVRVSVRGAKDRGASVMASSADGGRSVGAWAPDAEAGVELTVPEGASGLVHVDVVVPRKEQRALVAAGAFLARPAILPRVGGKVVSGTARPGGTVTVEAVLQDGQGGPLPGTIAVVVIDRFGGGNFGGLAELDTRGSLCRSLGVNALRCDELLESAPGTLARERVAGARPRTVGPARDPGAAVAEEAEKTFRTVVHSLEGAIYEASNDEPSRLSDVRRKEGRGWGFNPELLTLATAAMDPAPITPGGEPIALADLIAVDRQVSFDNVARRVTRLKLYRVLQAIHDHRRDEGLLDPDEPAVRDAGAMLRRLVRAGAIGEPMLVDPWGGRITAWKADAKTGLPFVRPAPGWELRSPGPDGRLGNADDVRDPFERVVDSGTPYAKAVDEDRIVDARYDMRVAEATVSNWRAMLEELTGTTLGSGEIGHGSGTGTGQGFGSGSGRLGGSHRSRGTSSLPSGVAFWSGPRRTDAQGRLRIDVPLGDVETTWSIGLVGVPDGARPAFSSFPVAAKLPLSARVDAGARWVEGDRVGVAITLKNRTESDVDATLAVAASGAMVLDGAAPTKVRVPRQGSVTVRAPVRAARAGQGRIDVTTSGPGAPGDRLSHTVEVARAGEELVVSRAAFVGEHAVDLSVALERRGLVGLGPATLVLERADAGVLRAAVESLDPDGLLGDVELADAMDVGSRVSVWATARLGQTDALTVAAARLREGASGRLGALPSGQGYASLMRAGRWAENDKARRALGATDDCPKEAARAALPPDALLDLLDAEPSLEAGAMKPCWGAFIGETLSDLQEESSPIAIARAITALAERRHREEDVRALTKRLAGLVELRASGAIAVDRPSARADRAMVYAALLRAPERTLVADGGTLAAWLLVQRDARGSFGSSTATRAAVRALLSPGGGLDAEGTAKARVTLGDDAQEVTLPTGKPLRLPIANGVDALEVESLSFGAAGGGFFARVERRFLRPYASPAMSADPSLRLLVRWPEAKVGLAAPVRIVLGQEQRGKRQVDVRVHLPPGAHLAASVDGVREVQGQLIWRATVGDGETFVEVPVRFDLGGRVTIAEATASDVRGASEPARAPARPFVIAP